VRDLEQNVQFALRKRFQEAEEKGELGHAAAIEKIHVPRDYTPDCVKKYDELGEDGLEEEMQAKLESFFIDSSSHGVEGIENTLRATDRFLGDFLETANELYECYPPRNDAKNFYFKAFNAKLTRVVLNFCENERSQWKPLDTVTLVKWMVGYNEKLNSLEGTVNQLAGSDVSDEKLKQIFDELDEDGSGELDHDEIAKALLNLGRTELEIHAMLSTLKKEALDLDDFKELILEEKLPRLFSDDGDAETLKMYHTFVKVRQRSFRADYVTRCCRAVLLSARVTLML
jgi:hypothetical protein